MARIFSEGFEIRSSAHFEAYATLVHTTGVGGAGTQAISLSGQAGQVVRMLVDRAEFFFRVYVHTGGSANLVDRIIFYDESAVTQAVLRFGENTTVRLHINGIEVAASTATFTSWGRIEVYYKFDNSGQIIVRLNGTEIINYSGDTAVSGTYIKYVDLRNAGSSTNASFDDVAINDTTGSEQNSWPGHGHIRMLLPNGNGSSSEWMGSDGNSTDNYLLVDDPASSLDSDATYVYATEGNKTDDYQLGTYTLQAGESVRLVWDEVVLRKDTGDTPDVAHGIISGSTEIMSPDIDPTTTYRIYKGQYLYTNPETNEPWDQTGIDNLKVVIRTAAS